MLQRELKLGPIGATPLEMDATAVLSGAEMETVTRKQRFNAARLGMLRQWAQGMALRLVKVGTADMRSDIIKQLQRLARLILTGSAEAADAEPEVASSEVN
jgi:hypothetical protein